MAVSRREKSEDENYSSTLGYLLEENLEEELQPTVENVISDLRDDVNDLCDLANKVDGLTFTYTPKDGKSKAKLTITVADGTEFKLEA
jgi:hypothetical protein